MEQVQDLNYDFNHNMFLASSMLSNLDSMGERNKAVKWMRKLAKCNKSLEEMKLRNDFMYYLVLNIQNRDLRPPFVDNPPPGPLPQLAELLPGGGVTNVEQDDKWLHGDNQDANKPLIYQNSPDGGAFLASQPVPRCGAFCYLAVVSRSKKQED